MDPTMQPVLALRHGLAPGVRCLTIAGLTLWCLGLPTQAVQRSQEALTLALALVHPYSLAATHLWVSLLYQRRRDIAALAVQSDALVTLATTQGLPLLRGYGTWLHGWALAMQGQVEEGLVELRQGLTALRATGQELSQPPCMVSLAQVMGHAGQVTEGLRLLAEAVTMFEADGRGDMLGEAYRLQGILLLRQAVPDVVQGEACLQQALALARRQHARSWELRAAMSLARLWQQQGKRTAAYDLLAPIYGWFTEGFDTADLRDAKALLVALA
jgi:predicted ATPase